MSSDRPDPFEYFAKRRGLQISTAELPAVPRDVLAPPTDLDWHTLVTLSGPSADAAPIRTLFVTEASDQRPPSIRDVLWWLSSDCWAIEQADRDYKRWAATYHYPDNDSATQRLFRLHMEQTLALVATLGESAYKELLSVYEAEVRSNAEHASATD